LVGNAWLDFLFYNFDARKYIFFFTIINMD
jgi:hypothetical protein